MKIAQQIDNIGRYADRVTEGLAPSDPNRQRLTSIKTILSTIQKDLHQKQHHDHLQSN